MGDENIQQCSHQHKHWCAFLHKAELYITFRNFLSFRSLVSTISIGLQIKQQVTGPTESGCNELLHQCIVTEAPFLHGFDRIGSLHHWCLPSCRTHPSQHAVWCLLYSRGTRSTESFRTMCPRTVKQNHD